MKSRWIATCLVITSATLGPASPARADADGLVGGIVGGIVGGLIVNQATKPRQQQVQPQRRYVAPTPQMSQATRRSNMEVQTALNYFGFPSGVADGVLGGQSRRAISQYQAYLGYPPTGELSLYERDFLTGSYQRAMAGGASTMQMVAADPQGPRGLLLTYRNQLAGAAQMAPAVPPLPAPLSPPVAAAAPPAPAAAAPTLALAPSPALPSFGAASPAQASLASQCNTVSLQTTTNGGFATLASQVDPAFVLDEQFCLARTYAISEGEVLAARLSGVSPQQVTEQCKAFEPALRDYVTALSLQPAASILPRVASFAATTGMSASELGASARICLSVGYRTDDMGVAIGSALLLTALGEQAYAELIGHHLADGMGIARRPDLAISWYDLGFAAPAPVFAPGQPERTELVRKAAYAVGGVPPSADETRPVPTGLPSFAAPVGTTP